MASQNFLMLIWHARFIKAAVLYNLLLFSIFFFVYVLLDFSKHFDSNKTVTNKGKLYYAVMVHTSAGTGDIAPKTDTGRMVTALHVGLAWSQLMLAFLA